MLPILLYLIFITHFLFKILESVLDRGKKNLLLIHLTSSEYFILHISHISHVHSFHDGDIGWFHHLTITKTLAMNTSTSFPLWNYTWVTLGYLPGNGVAGSLGICVLNLVSHFLIVLQNGCISLHSQHDSVCPHLQ